MKLSPTSGSTAESVPTTVPFALFSAMDRIAEIDISRCSWLEVSPVPVMVTSIVSEAVPSADVTVSLS